MQKWILLSLALLTLTATLQAQGQPADFKRAQEWRAKAESLVDNKVTAWGWGEEEGSLWYGVSRQQETDFFLVSPQGQKSPAFDKDALRSEFRRLNLGRPEILRLKLARSGLSLLTTAGMYAWDASAKRLSPSVAEFDELPPLDIRQTTQGSGSQTLIIFSNELSQPVETFWVTEDGRRMSYGKIAQGQSRTQNSYVGHVWLITDDKGNPLRTYRAELERSLARINSVAPVQPKPPTSPWIPSPTGESEVMIRNNNLVIRRPAGTEKALTTDGTAQDFYSQILGWAPNGKHLAVFQRIPGQNRIITIVRSSPGPGLQPEVMRIPYDKPGDKLPIDRVRIINIETGVVTKPAESLFGNLFETRPLRWLNDDTYAFLANERGHQRVEIFALNASAGSARSLVRETSPTFIDWTNKTSFEISPNGKEGLWMSERSGTNHLYLVNLESGEITRQVTSGPWIVREIVSVDWESRTVLFSVGGWLTSQDPVDLKLAKTNLDSGRSSLLTPNEGDTQWRFSPGGTAFVAESSQVDRAPSWELRDSLTGALRVSLSTATTSRLEAQGWKKPIRFKAKGRDGKTDIYGVIYLPTNLKKGVKLPVIENVYAGPHGAHVPRTFASWRSEQSLAELGFIVVQADGMGTNHRGKAFHDVAWKNLADAGFPDRIAWIKAAAKVYPEMDLTRVGIYGTSAGGQTALGALLLHNDFYRVAVSDCGCHDNRMDKVWWNEQWMGYPVGPHYGDQSNVTLAPRLKGKLLLMVGEVDTNVDPASTTQVVNALIAANKDFDFILAPNVGHGVLGTAYGRRRMEDFFLLHLVGVVAKRE
ncbi:MAG: prolyl oligopeptidase family serine peptidase [Fimbriimonadaceae bacterium]|nr:prolyl oligopeptidase family serine peptidase [Fimbriimonadaceae bacterium]